MLSYCLLRRSERRNQVRKYKRDTSTIRVSTEAMEAISNAHQMRKEAGIKSTKQMLWLEAAEMLERKVKRERNNG